MLRLLKALILLPIALAVAAFAVANRQTALVALWPLPYEIDTPVFFLVLAPLAAGLLLGGAVAWLAGGKTRRLARERGRKIRNLERAANAVQAQTPALPP